MFPVPAASPAPLTRLQTWLVIIVAVIGFAFDTYELLMLPLINNAAISELLQVQPSNPLVRDWFLIINAAAAVSGGIFGLLGGWLIDRFGRKRILVLSILIYGLSPVAAAFSTNIYSFMIFRCTTFIGVCVEFVAAVAWLAELFPEKRKREMVLGFTQVFASFGGFMVTGVKIWLEGHAINLPAIGVDAPFNPQAPWRYTLISGLIPAIPILLLLPFIPESPIWRERKSAGTLKRPSFGQLFSPELSRTTITATLLLACCYGAAFGAIQLAPKQITPGLPELVPISKELDEATTAVKQKQQEIAKLAAESPEKAAAQKELPKLLKEQRELRSKIEEVGDKVQLLQETGGLFGRIVLWLLALFILSRRLLLWVFVVPGIFIVPYVFLNSQSHGQDFLMCGIFAAALVTIAQFSYWGNYLPAAYPVHLRGTAGGFAANVGGRMLGSNMGLLTGFVVAPLFIGPSYAVTAQAAAYVGGGMFVLAFVISCWLPQPKESAE